MTTKHSLFATAVALAVVLAGVAPAVASDGSNSLSVAVEQSGENPVVSVTHNGSAAENASVSVTATNNSSYTGVGGYTTDDNGTVSLPAPAENVTVEVAATKGNASGSTTVELLATEEEEEDGDETPEFENFGQHVSWFVMSLLEGDVEGGIGQVVSDFVTANNPGADNRPDHAGPAGELGPDNSTAEGADAGSPDDHPGNGNGNGGNGNGNNGNGHGDDHPGKGNGKEKALQSAW